MTQARARLEKLIDRLPAMAGQPDGAAALAFMLPEDRPHFSGLSAEEADWLRGHLYAAIALSSDPAPAAGAAREDLRTSASPIVLAGIARMLRAMDAGASWQADVDAAAQRIRFDDIYPDFRFDPPTTCCRPALTCQGELEAARADMAGAAAPPADDEAECLGPLTDALAETSLEDQSGNATNVAALADGRPLVLLLFYTRCMNTLKCSLAVTRLGQAAARLPGLSFAGMTYDPAFDTPPRLLAYGAARNVAFGPNARLVRATRGWPALRDALGLRAGYGGSTVNAHARELFLLDRDGQLFRLPPDWLGDPERLEDFAQGAEQLLAIP